MLRRKSPWLSSIFSVLFLLVTTTILYSVHGLSQRTTPKRISNLLLHPSLQNVKASTRTKGGNHLGYTSHRSTPETSKDAFALSRRQYRPILSELDYIPINTAATTTRTPTVATLPCVMDPLDTSRIDISPILPANASAITTIPVMTTTTTTSLSSKSLWVLSNKIWNRIQAATHVDKEAIAKLGVAFGLTYNLISNINGSISLSLAWYIASVKTGLSPLAPGQWKTLLAAYGTLYVFLCFIRPFRIALAIGVTGKVENMLQRIQMRFGCHRSTVLGVAILCSVSLWLFLCAVGVTVASTMAGVPFWRISSSL